MIQAADWRRRHRAGRGGGLVRFDGRYCGVSVTELATVKLLFADLVGFGNDTLRGADDLGTDGRDLVWLEGRGRNDAGQYAAVSVMTSPYRTDPAAVAPRRLRSESGSFFGASSFKVGCGYAVRITQLGTWGDLIVRLSDGQSWFLTSTSSAWNWVDPIAVNCTEVLTVVALAGSTRTVARVRLDSLGPGIPPD